MPRTSNIFLQCLTYCFLIGLTYALDGNSVTPVRLHDKDKFAAVVSISRRYSGPKFQHQHFCTGTLVHRKSIVTAAHCLAGRKPDDIEIIAGSLKLSKGKKYYPESWTVFDPWNQQHGNRNLIRNDIAVIKLKGDGIPEITPVELFLRDTLDSDKRAFIITGWGDSFKGNPINNLRRATVHIISNEECGERSLEVSGRRTAVPPNFFCTRADPHALVTCGDGGAPIFNRDYKLVGISVGTCPNLEGYLFNDDEFVRDHKMNTHLRVHFYKDFILHA